MENEDNNLEKTNSKQNDSIINININNSNENNIENEKKELLPNIIPKITENISQNDNVNNNLKEDDSLIQITKEEYKNYKEKKIKLYNFYQTLLDFRQKLIIKEKHLDQREKNLLEFEKVLQANESILKNNIEQFETYMRSRINEIKSQFNKIEQIQLNKEQYLKQREEEITRETNYINQMTNNNINIRRCSNCNYPLFNEDELNDQFININNNYCDTCNSEQKNFFHPKSKSVNNTPINNNNFIQEKYLEHSNQTPNQKRFDDKLYNRFNNINYTCYCPACKFCNNL